MNPQAASRGAILGRRLNPILIEAAKASPDAFAHSGGLLAALIGGIAGTIGRHAAIELVRISLARLEDGAGIPQLALPPGVREQATAAAAATAQDVIDAAANAADNLDDELKQQRDAFNAAINFALDKAGPECRTFLELWREGGWPEIAEAFPEFKGPFPGAPAPVAAANEAQR